MFTNGARAIAREVKITMI